MDAEHNGDDALLYTGQRCHVVALTNDNKQAWVANIEDNNISIVDTETFRIVGTIPTGRGRPASAFPHDGKFAYVSTRRQNRRHHRHLDAPDRQIAFRQGQIHFLVVGPVHLGHEHRRHRHLRDRSRDARYRRDLGGRRKAAADRLRLQGHAGSNVYVTVGGTNSRGRPADPKNLKGA
ncbi:MAG: hypothetical protein U0231_01045 [Nitrospiraceae bacterium]